MAKTVLLKALRVGRATALALGVAVMVALVLGLASAALGADTDLFKVGRSNFAESVSKLIKSGAGPALELQVDSGAPLKVNSGGRVARLNSDRLDGKDSAEFLPNALYSRSSSSPADPSEANSIDSEFAPCDDARDQVVSGGFENTDTGTVIRDSHAIIFPSVGNDKQGWRVEWLNDGSADSVTVTVRCIDLSP